MNAKDVQVIYNGMNIQDFNQIPKGEYKKKNGINSPYLLYLGRLDKLKGIDHIIEAFSLLPEEFSEYKLIIAGNITEYKKELDVIIKNNKLEDKVIFTGFIAEKDKINIFADAELFITPVKYMGGVSITVLESILADTPVIVTLESGEIIEKIDAGTIVEYGDVTALKNEIIHSLTDKEMVEKQLKNGQDYIKNNLEWENVSKKILGIYEKIIENGE